MRSSSSPERGVVPRKRGGRDVVDGVVGGCRELGWANSARGFVIVCFGPRDDAELLRQSKLYCLPYLTLLNREEQD